MKRFIKSLSVVSLALCSSISLATAPPYLVTHNTTDVESNAYVAGSIPAPQPSKPHADNKVLWMVVKMACHGHTTNNWCPALIKMATNTGSPIELGYVSMNLDTGEIIPKELHAGGYSLYVNGPAEATLVKG